MEREENTQLELFSRIKDSDRLTARKDNKSLLAWIWNYEKTILLIIGIIVSCIISYSIGIEKGKKIVLLKDNFQKAKPIEAREQVIPVPKVTTNPSEETSEQILAKKGAYTIQLASYKTKTYAQKEAQTLKKKGLAPLVLNKGSFTVLCVGSFSNKETAQPLLTEFSKRYKGCYLRRL